MILLTIIFFVLVLVSLLDMISSRYKNIIFISLGFVLFCIAAFRQPYIDRDYSNYLRLFNMKLYVGRSLAEPSFVIISDFIHLLLFDNPVFLFMIYAGIGVTTKLIAIKKLSKHIFTKFEHRLF